MEDLKYRVKLEQQVGLSDLTQGHSNYEIRLWYDWPLSSIKDLYILRLQDTLCNFSYHRIYPKPIDYDDENRNREWNPFTDPIVDSSVSKSVLLTRNEYNTLHIDSIWSLKSQSELKIPDSIGFFDCDSYVLEIGDKDRFKYLRYHCPTPYYNQTKRVEILTFLDFCERIIALARKHNVVVPYK